MPIYTVLDRLPIGVLLIANMAVLAIAVKFGFAWGRHIRKRSDTGPDAAISTTVSAALSLLAFLLTITFSIAASIFESRRMFLLDETNALGTTWLRTGLLAEPYRTTTRELLCKYVDRRLEAIGSGNIDQGLREAQALQDQLWSQAVAVGASDPHSITSGLFINSLNEVIDMYTKRVTMGIYTRLPAIVWLALYLVAVIALALVGYQAGLTARRRVVATALLILAFSIIFVLVSDLDRPGSGFIKVNQRPLLDLQKSMHAAIQSP